MQEHSTSTSSDDWWERGRRNRERIERELGDREFPDIADLIRQMRNERDIELLGGIYGEAKAREMVLEPDADREAAEARDPSGDGPGATS